MFFSRVTTSHSRLYYLTLSLPYPSLVFSTSTTVYSREGIYQGTSRGPVLTSIMLYPRFLVLAHHDRAYCNAPVIA